MLSQAETVPLCPSEERLMGRAIYGIIEGAVGEFRKNHNRDLGLK